MKLIIMQDLLKAGLSTVGRAVATRSTLPVLGNVLLAAGNDTLRLAATNLEIAITTRIPARVMDPGAITLPARLLADVVSALPGLADVTLTLNDRTAAATVECGRHKSTVKGISHDEFPHVPDAEELAFKGLKPVRLPAAAFRALASRVAFAAATEEARPILTGVLVDMTDAGVTFAAADGFRLAVGSDASWTARTARAIIPATAMDAAARLVGDAEFVELYLEGDTRALFSMGKTEVVSQLIAGQFPDYHQIVPKSWTTRAVFDAGDMLAAVKVANLFARDAANLVKLWVGEGLDNERLVSVTGASAETGDGASDIDAEVTGPGVEIAFNARYLADAIAAVGTKDAALELTTGNSPGVVRPVGGDDWLCVVMPMNVTR